MYNLTPRIDVELTGRLTLVNCDKEIDELFVGITGVRSREVRHIRNCNAATISTAGQQRSSYNVNKKTIPTTIQYYTIDLFYCQNTLHIFFIIPQL